MLDPIELLRQLREFVPEPEGMRHNLTLDANGDPEISIAIGPQRWSNYTLSTADLSKSADDLLSVDLLKATRAMIAAIRDLLPDTGADCGTLTNSQPNYVLSIIGTMSDRSSDVAWEVYYQVPGSKPRCIQSSEVFVTHEQGLNASMPLDLLGMLVAVRKVMRKE